MARQEDKVALSKKGKREVSSFIGHELLYDYLSNSLDEERKAAVADHIKFSRDAQLDLAKIQNGQSYAEQLADTVVSQPIIDQINAPSTYLTVLMQKTNFARWPQGLKWGLEALVVVAVIVSLLTIAPWEKVINVGLNSGSKEVILAEITKTPQATMPEVPSEPGAFVDEDVKPGKTATPEASTSVAKEQKKEADKPVPAPIATAKPSATTPVVAVTPTSTSSAAATGGFLYRGEIAVTNLDVVGPKIKDKIGELGGRKAGDVELGWKRTESSLYFHFTIPEAKEQELLTFLSAYGKPKISKEKHPRVMPDGIIRLIITVDEAKR